MHRNITTLCWILAGWLAWGCAGCASNTPGALEAAVDQRPWAQMDFAARRSHMQTAVMPIAAEVFGAWRPDRFSSVDCALCHGWEAAAGIYRMPTAHLPRLSGKLLLGPELKDHPETTRLKLDRLVPQMAAALDRNTFNLVTRRGFGCYSCHLGPSGPLFGN